MLIGCDQGVLSPEERDALDAKIYEAQLMALFLTGDLQPTESYVTDLRQDLQRIRNNVSSAFPEVLNIDFMPPWFPGRVSLGFIGEYVDSIRDVSYSEWDSLNDSFSVYRIHSFLDFGESIYCDLFADSLLHPKRMAEQYYHLNGVDYASPSFWGGDRSNIYPLQYPSMRTYLVRFGDGDCESGCYLNKYWYFRVRNSSVEFIGYWDATSNAPSPNWWNEAEQNIENFHAH